MSVKWKLNMYLIHNNENIQWKSDDFISLIISVPIDALCLLTLPPTCSCGKHLALSMHRDEYAGENFSSSILFSGRENIRS